MAAASIAALQGRIARYYAAKVDRYGPTPAGVDWPSERTQFMRFAQLLRVCDFSQPTALDDIGCGYGALLGFVDRQQCGGDVDYLGLDVCPAMIEEARALWGARRHAAFAVGSRSPRRPDYAVASGIFNVRIDEPLRLWERFVEETLRSMAAASRRGFAVNFLKPLPAHLDDGGQEQYRPQPRRWAAFCESALGKQVQLLEGYGLREVTLLARS